MNSSSKDILISLYEDLQESKLAFKKACWIINSSLKSIVNQHDIQDFELESCLDFLEDSCYIEYKDVEGNKAIALTAQGFNKAKILYENNQGM